MMDHVEHQLSEGTWNLMGWFKAVTTKEDGVVQPKFHVVRLEKNSAIERFVVPRAVDDQSRQQDPNIQENTLASHLQNRTKSPEHRVRDERDVIDVVNS